jgi:hypothetical protein
MEILYIDGLDPRFICHDVMSTKWFDISFPFTSVKNLYPSKTVLLRIALVLQDLTRQRSTQVFPALQSILSEGFQPSVPVQEGIAEFISARQPTNHPVATSVWDRDPVWANW